MATLRILGVFDNGGATLDRYTFVFNERDGDNYQMLGTSETGEGFSQFCSGHFNYHGDNSHLGKPVQWHQLSDQLKQHVEGRIA